MTGRASSLALWVAAGAVALLVVARAAPWLWARMFPSPAPVESVVTPLARQAVGDAVHLQLVAWGASLPDEGAIELPRGRTPLQLQEALRAHPELLDAEVYVTELDELTHKLRVFGGGRLLLERPVQRWLPERPQVPEPAPALAFVVVVREPAQNVLAEAGRWPFPVAFAVPPFAPHALRTARQATLDHQAVLVLADPQVEPGPQLAALPEAMGVLVEAAPSDRWLEEVQQRRFVIDASGEARAGLRLAGWLGTPRAAKEARVLSIRRGYGVVAVEATSRGIEALREFVEEAGEDGYRMRFPAEVARELR